MDVNSSADSLSPLGTTSGVHATFRGVRAAVRGARDAVRIARLAVAMTLLGLACAVQAQALNARWHGRWVDEADSKNTLAITDKVFTVNGKACTWSQKPVSGVKACMAFYEGKSAKSDLVAGVQAAESVMSTLTPKEAQDLRARVRHFRTLLQDLSNDTFRTVLTRTPDQEMGSGDCGGFYLLDKESIYSFFTCAPAPDAVSIVRFRRQPPG